MLVDSIDFGADLMEIEVSQIVPRRPAIALLSSRRACRCEKGETDGSGGSFDGGDCATEWLKAT